MPLNSQTDITVTNHRNSPVPSRYEVREVVNQTLEEFFNEPEMDLNRSPCTKRYIDQPSHVKTGKMTQSKKDKPVEKKLKELDKFLFAQISCTTQLPPEIDVQFPSKARKI